MLYNSPQLCKHGEVNQVRLRPAYAVTAGFTFYHH
jgi:hypothetical protein